MARDHTRVNLAIWSDPDWRALPPAAQHLYMTLWTSPGRTYCGTHDWRPKRLVKLSAGFTVEHLGLVAACLQARHFLVIDEDTEEALIRSWARFDGLMRQPRMAVSYATAYAEVASPTLRGVLVTETRKIRDLEPDLACWKDKRVTSLLDHPAISARDLVTPDDPFGDGFGGHFALGLPSVSSAFGPNASQGLPPVCTPPTTATTTSTDYSLQQPADESTGGESHDPPTTIADDSFEDWWSHYPRKVGKGQARKAYRAATKKADPEALVVALVAQAPGLIAKGTEFCPHPATWLNGERWLDERPAGPKGEADWMRRRLS